MRSDNKRLWGIVVSLLMGLASVGHAMTPVAGKDEPAPLVTQVPAPVDAAAAQGRETAPSRDQEKPVLKQGARTEGVSKGGKAGTGRTAAPPAKGRQEGRARP